MKTKIEAAIRLKDIAKADVAKSIAFFKHYGIDVSVIPKKVPLGRGGRGMINLQLDTPVKAAIAKLTKAFGKPEAYNDSIGDSWVWDHPKGHIQVMESKESRIPNTVSLVDFK